MFSRGKKQSSLFMEGFLYFSFHLACSSLLRMRSTVKIILSLSTHMSDIVSSDILTYIETRGKNYYIFQHGF